MKLERTWEVSKLLTILQPIPRLSLGVWDEGAPCLPIQGEEAGSGKGVTENRHFGDRNFRV